MSPAPASPIPFSAFPIFGLVTVTEVAEHWAAIRAVFPGPLVVDADTGFGNPLNMVRTVELLERAGADALQIEEPGLSQALRPLRRKAGDPDRRDGGEGQRPRWTPAATATS